MIVRPRPGTLDLLFALRGSVVPLVAPRVALVTGIALVLALLDRRYSGIFPEFSAAPFTVLGLTLSIFPKASCGKGKRSLETSWLLSHWNDWFCYTYMNDELGQPAPVPVEGTLVIQWDEREIVIKNNADSRPA